MPEPTQTQTPDWAAEAAKFGGKYIPPSSTPAASATSSSQPDWAAEAAKFGGTYVPPKAPAPDPRAQSKIEARTPGLWETITAPVREGALGRALHLDTGTAASHAAAGETASNAPILKFTAAAPNDDGAIHTASKFLEDLTTPAGLATLAGTSGLGAVESAFGKSTLSKLVQYGFSANMLSNAIQTSPAVMDAIKAGDWNKARGLATSVLLNAGFGAHMAGAGNPLGENTPRTTPAPPVDLMGGRSTLPMPDEMPAAIGNATRVAKTAIKEAIPLGKDFIREKSDQISGSDSIIGKAARTVGTVTGATKAIPGDLYEINPGRGLVHAYGKGIDRRLVNDIESTRADIVAHGGPVESNADILKFGPVATKKFKTEYDRFLDRARENEQQQADRGEPVGFDISPIIEATINAIPKPKRQAAANSEYQSDIGKQIAKITENARLDYGGRRVTADQLDAIRETLVDDVNKLYKMNPADRNAAEGSGTPLTVLEAQRKAVNKILYEGIDPETGGARPRELNKRRGRIIGLMKEAQDALNDLDSQKQLSSLETVGGAVAGLAKTVGSPFHGDIQGSVGQVVHPVIGKSDAIIRRIFKGAKKSQPIPSLPIPDTGPAYIPEPPPVIDTTPPPFKSAWESAQILANAPVYKPTARGSATVFQGGATRPVVPETGLPENIARLLAGREELAKSLGMKLENLSAKEIIALDKLVQEGYGSAQPSTSKPPVTGPRP